MGLKVSGDEVTLAQRQRVAQALQQAIDTAKENDVGPVSFSDLLLAVGAKLCKMSGIGEEDFINAARGHYREKTIDPDNDLMH